MAMSQREQNMQSAREVLVLFYEAKKKLAEAEREMREIQDNLIGKMKKLRVDSLSLDYEGARLKGALVESSVIKIDELRLRKSLGAKMFDRYTKRVLDKDKLEHGMAIGEIDPREVAQCSEDVPRAPYVRVTRK